MLLIIITPEKTLNDETGIVNRLFTSGLQRLHVRKPSFSVEDYRNYLAGIDKQHYSRIVVHGCFELYEELKLGGIHLNGAMRNDSAVWGNIGNISPVAISTSFHDWKEIEENDFCYRYFFISPVFNSISKKGYLADVAVSGAKETKNKLKQEGRHCPKIIGLGGVGERHIKTLHENDFDGLAMLGAIWMAQDPVEEFKKILDVVTSL